MTAAVGDQVPAEPSSGGFLSSVLRGFLAFWLGIVRFVTSRAFLLLALAFLVGASIFALKFLDIGFDKSEFFDDWRTIIADVRSGHWSSISQMTFHWAGWIKFALLLLESFAQGAAASAVLTFVAITIINNSSLGAEIDQLANTVLRRIRGETFYVDRRLADSVTSLFDQAAPTLFRELNARMESLSKDLQEATDLKQKAEQEKDDALNRVAGLDNTITKQLKEIAERDATIAQHEATAGQLDDLILDLTDRMKKFRDKIRRGG
ncbi:MAG: hypothetical protein QM759_14715 [Terricaulis sp.]